MAGKSLLGQGRGRRHISHRGTGSGNQGAIRSVRLAENLISINPPHGASPENQGVKLSNITIVHDQATLILDGSCDDVGEVPATAKLPFPVRAEGFCDAGPVPPMDF